MRGARDVSDNYHDGSASRYCPIGPFIPHFTSLFSSNSGNPASYQPVDNSPNARERRLQHSATPPVSWERAIGYGQFRGTQAAIIERNVSGGDSLVLTTTGGGKSLCYQIPSLLRCGVGIVISPLIALMQDQVDALVRHSAQNWAAQATRLRYSASATYRPGLECTPDIGDTTTLDAMRIEAVPTDHATPRIVDWQKCHGDHHWPTGITRPSIALTGPIVP